MKLGKGDDKARPFILILNTQEIKKSNNILAEPEHFE
jgi:hypothetical protein